MKTVCAESVLFGREAFETLGDVVVLPDRQISASDVRDADALVIRSKTRVNADLLEGSRVSFVGSATAGYDHMDITCLEHRPIAWCVSPGCNANSVSEYVTTALCCLAQRHQLKLDQMTIGVIGVGHVGSQVVRKAEALGMKVLQNDPPLKAATGKLFYMDLDPLLEQSDVVSLHVPLTRNGPCPTFRLANCHFFEHFKPGGVFINASRGEVLDSDGLLLALEHGTVRHVVLDVWDNEPYVQPEILRKIDIGTPHIAGYSYDGRLNGTMTVYREACHFYEIEPIWSPNPERMPMDIDIEIDCGNLPDEIALWEIVRRAYDIEEDDGDLRSILTMPESERAFHFDHLRRTYPERREFPNIRVRLKKSRPELARKIQALGFLVE